MSYRDDICWSRSPRIGEDGTTYCYLPYGHSGSHKSHPECGFGPVGWDDPIMRASDHMRLTAWLPEDAPMAQDEWNIARATP